MKRMMMPNEVEHSPAITPPGTWIRIIGTFDWTPTEGNTFAMERVTSGMCYHAETPMKVREVLETYSQTRTTRLALHYGDVETGEDWLDEWHMEGYIGRSTGRLTTPLLIANRRAYGGMAILDRCIIRIRFANRSVGGDLYRHPSYHADRNKLADNIPDPKDAERVWRRRFADA